ncbi:hypothetical protein WS69_09695 [Burkholderia sp. BDU5]|nr:hypothetical protein WS69_09695 [Burkholderia sp. BDU5]KVE44620.1 hypothetical protein WS70_06840 [Burkholderia mayonis]
MQCKYLMQWRFFVTNAMVSFFGSVGCIVMRGENRLEVRLCGNQLPMTARVPVPQRRLIACSRDPNGELFREMGLDGGA